MIDIVDAKKSKSLDDMAKRLDIELFYLKESKGLKIIKATTDVRQAVERKTPDIIYGMELDKKRDYMHQRNSGVNHTICEIAKKKGVAFALPIDEILGGNKVALGRAIQNIRLYRKYGNTVVASSFASGPYEMRGQRDLQSLLIELGMTSVEAKTALNGLKTIITKKKKSLGDGVELI